MKNNKIYLVVQGKYSDWEILGYTTDKHKAEKICALENEKNFNGVYTYPVTYFLESKSMDTIELNENIEPYQGYLIKIDVFKEPKVEVDYIKEEFISVKRDSSINLCYKDRDKESYLVCVYIPIPNNPSEGRARAEEIAEDYLHQYLAEEKGI